MASYKLVCVTDKPALAARASSMRSIETILQYEKELLLNDTFHLEDLLASYGYSEDEESIQNIKAVE